MALKQAVSMYRVRCLHDTVLHDTVAAFHLHRKTCSSDDENELKSHPLNTHLHTSLFSAVAFHVKLIHITILQEKKKKKKKKKKKTIEIFKEKAK
jgi:hypothetical protein